MDPFYSLHTSCGRMRCSWHHPRGRVHARVPSRAPHHRERRRRSEQCIVSSASSKPLRTRASPVSPARTAAAARRGQLWSTFCDPPSSPSRARALTPPARALRCTRHTTRRSGGCLNVISTRSMSKSEQNATVKEIQVGVCASSCAAALCAAPLACLLLADVFPPTP